MAKHSVMISVDGRKQLKYDKHCVHVERGDEITWKMKKEAPFAIMVKAFVSPLDWSFVVLGKGEKTIVGVVRENADPGFYPYGVCVFDGTDLIVDDPEIIVHPPKGG